MYLGWVLYCDIVSYSTVWYAEPNYSISEYDTCTFR